MTRLATAALATGALVAAFGAGWLVRDVTGEDAEAPGVPSAAPDREARSASPPLPDPAPRPALDPTRADAGASSSDRTATDPAAAPRRGGGASPTPSEDPRRAGRAAPPAPRTVAQFGEAIAEAYDRAHPEGLRPTPEELDAAALSARDRTEAEVLAAAAAADNRVKEQVGILERVLALRTARGVLAEGPAVLEFRATGRATIEGSSRPARKLDAGWDPFAVTPPFEDAVGISGGVLLPGTAFVVERVDVEARAERPESDDGEITVGTGTLQFGAVAILPRLRASFTGAEIVRDLGSLRLSVDESAARVRFTGRVVPASAVPEARPLVWVPEGAEGFLRTDRPVRLQIAADYGGGNPRTVDLAGRPNNRFDARPDRPVWDDAVAPSSLRRSVCWTEGAGLVPPGHRFRVQRIDWRARLEPAEKHSHSRFDIRLDALAEHSKIVETGATNTDVVSGTWTGDVAINPGEEARLTATCHMYGFADVTIYGRLESTAR